MSLSHYSSSISKGDSSYHEQHGKSSFAYHGVVVFSRCKNSGIGSFLPVIVAEAKKNDFEQGWGQCLTELVAAQKINQDAERAVYGVVTDGNLWQFGRLRKDVFTRNSENFTIDRLARLHGALECVVELMEQEDW